MIQDNKGKYVSMGSLGSFKGRTNEANSETANIKGSARINQISQRNDGDKDSDFERAQTPTDSQKQFDEDDGDEMEMEDVGDEINYNIAGKITNSRNTSVKMSD